MRAEQYCRWCEYPIFKAEGAGFEVATWLHFLTFDQRVGVPDCEPDMQSQYAEPDPEIPQARLV